jgi:hypothetical protein
MLEKPIRLHWQFLSDFFLFYFQQQRTIIPSPRYPPVLENTGDISDHNYMGL